MKKRLLCIFLLSVLACTMFVFASCGKERDYTEEPLTKEEIRSYVEKKYFDKDGNFINWYFENASNGYALKEPFKEADITDFDVQFIKDAHGNEKFFLVEFEPTFHIFGYREEAFEYPNKWQPSFWLRPFPSPYKILGINEEERYSEDFLYATKRDGYLVAIDDEALYGRYLTETRTGKLDGGTSDKPIFLTYDYEAEKWIKGTRNYVLHPYTEEEIREIVQKEFFYANGKPREYLWNNYRSSYTLRQKYDGKNITGFSLQLLTSSDYWQSTKEGLKTQKEKYFLVEFEQYGYILAPLFKEFDISWFRPYPSPFKISEIADDNRYVALAHKCATFIDGELTIIDDVLFDTVLVEPKGYKRRKTVYDFEKNAWVTIY